MALLDPQQSCIVLRVVYDGPALAGKTTNLRVLSKSLGVDIFSAEEAEGRTLYFDWVDYVGGLFDGLPIRCQIISVPGQQVLEGRRRMLLETADVVVFVADSNPELLQENAQSFALLRQIAAQKAPPLGIVLQANKRDLKEAISPSTLRQTLGSEMCLAMTEASAERGDGVRETFVLAVRLALDRVRALKEQRALHKLSPEIDDGFELLSAMQEAEASASPSLPSETQQLEERRGPSPFSLAPPQATSKSTVGGSGPPFPHTSIPPGLVWPPVEGRMAVHESSRAEKRLERSGGGDWIAMSEEWKLRSPLEGLFFELETARLALVDWVRWHVAAGDRLSAGRCTVLMPEAGDVWRLWQIVRRQPSLEEMAHELFAQDDDAVLGRGLFRIIDLRLRAETLLVNEGWLGRLSLASIGLSDLKEPVFIDFAPYPGGASGRVGATTDEALLLRDELGPFMRGALQRVPRRLPVVLSSLQEAAAASHRSDIAAAVQQILLAS